MQSSRGFDLRSGCVHGYVALVMKRRRLLDARLCQCLLSFRSSDLVNWVSSQVREWVGATGMENLGKKLVNAKEKIEFEKPKPCRWKC